ncbi:MAG: LPS export ABC transporter periplasmic protein LptC [Gammaproteobacteria bacterium]|nr:LPS export ABC transporter periplasmic protein LptC [Gammaproteobacteria bacterium]MBT4608060.1 LPS export ABC transporter periplasmic protein LptC [Thiotrichales bacterium]MBT3471481.1 LPS export ABC transporter periplasmic protein LptC [Gammaproteobacteria bacterium]MBT3967669.1 LPS export ABC transporter periplasmic protein LptC [Gammaproteobacteria bacterium]MBT4079594.1 LPS export ABC transporter periplasmic protein LptC [Gammaproteobacteria bacterium]
MKNIITFLLVLAVVATWYLAPQPKKVERKVEIPTDYFIVQFDRKKMDKAGKVASTFHADRVDHYPNQNHAEMVQPRAITYTEGNPPWFLRADHGIQYEETNRITLSGDVVANQRYRKSEKFSLIESEMLDLFTDEEYLVTDQPITFSTESSVTQSIGAKAWMGSGIVQLLKNATGHYQP